MPSSAPPGLGDVKGGEFLLRPEEHPLPQGRKELLARIETLLSEGGVQKLIIELGRPIKLFRLIPKDELLSPPPQAPDDDLWIRLHNSLLEETVAVTGVAPNVIGPTALFFGFDEVRKRGMRPAALFVPSMALFRTWMGLSKGYQVDQVFGVPVSAPPDMPGDAVVLAAVSYDELNPEAYGIRIPMDLPKEKKE